RSSGTISPPSRAAPCRDLLGGPHRSTMRILLVLKQSSPTAAQPTLPQKPFVLTDGKLRGQLCSGRRPPHRVRRRLRDRPVPCAARDGARFWQVFSSVDAAAWRVAASGRSLSGRSWLSSLLRSVAC